MKKIVRTVNCVLGAALALLGFSACDGTMADEYGTPTVDYQVKGTVTDEAGNPIENIQVTLENETDTMRTDANGQFQSPELRSISISPRIKFEDTDGSANGLFVSTTTSLDEAEQTQLEKGDGNWYQGKFEVNIQQQLRRLDK